MSSTIGQIASTDYLHWKLIIDFIMIFQERDELSLNNIDRIILGMIGQPMEMDIKCSFTDDSHEQ